MFQGKWGCYSMNHNFLALCNAFSLSITHNTQLQRSSFEDFFFIRKLYLQLTNKIRQLLDFLEFIREAELLS